MKILKKRGQGATEYLLMLAAVLVIVAVAIYYITRAAPTALITGTASLGTNNVTFNPGSATTPSPIPAADWRYVVLNENKAQKYPATGWGPGVDVLRIGTPITMTAEGVVRNDYLRIQYKEKDYWDFTIV